MDPWILLLGHLAAPDLLMLGTSFALNQGQPPWVDSLTQKSREGGVREGGVAQSSRNCAPNLREIAGIRFVHQRKDAQKCLKVAQIWKSILDNLCKYPFSNTPYLKFLTDCPCLLVPGAAGDWLPASSWSLRLSLRTSTSCIAPWTLVVSAARNSTTTRAKTGCTMQAYAYNPFWWNIFGFQDVKK